MFRTIPLRNPGLALVATNNRFRDGSYSNFNNTDLIGNAGCNEILPLFSWYVIESDTTRYKTTGIHVVYDAGGPADGSPDCGASGSAPCGNSKIGSMLANTAKRVEYDLYYLRNWSLTFDLQIIIMTALHAFNSKNAY